MFTVILLLSRFIKFLVTEIMAKIIKANIGENIGIITLVLLLINLNFVHHNIIYIFRLYYNFFIIYYNMEEYIIALIVIGLLYWYVNHNKNNCIIIDHFDPTVKITKFNLNHNVERENLKI
jgi:hypothetical protein